MSSQSQTTAVFSEGIDELLLRWSEGRLEGKDITPEDLCADKPELTDELARRIHAIRSMEHVLGVGAETTDSAAADTANDPPLTFEIPGYELMGVLGHGGMGVVYKARQVRPNRVVAIKMILAGSHARIDQLARFRAEAEAAAQLLHPNIVPIYEVGEWKAQPYFSMEYIDGGSLAQRLARGLLPVREAAELVRTLAGAVHFAHERGIVHRDLKPGNILLDHNAHNFTPKITDFGLAKRLDSDRQPPVESPRTQTGAVLGTPSYLAPEQAEGRNQEIGPAADIYALGAILYEALTGRPPFQGESTLDTLEQVRSREPLPPRRLRQSVPRDLETVCLKCLEKQPGKRYGNAGELAADVGRFLAGEPILARRTPLWEQGFKLARRKPAQTALAVVSLAAVIGVLGVWAAFTSDLRSARDRAWQHEQKAQEQARLALENKQAADRERAEAQHERDLVKELNSYSQRLLMRCQEDVKWHIDATLEGKRAKEASGEPHALLYVLARSYSMTAAAYRKDLTLAEADRNKQADYYADRAVELLRKAFELGYFHSGQSRAKFKDDKDLNELHGRSDFQQLSKSIDKLAKE